MASVVAASAGEMATVDPSSVSSSSTASAIDKVVFDACVEVTRGDAEPQVVAFQFLFRHFDGMQDLKNADGFPIKKLRMPLIKSFPWRKRTVAEQEGQESRTEGEGENGNGNSSSSSASSTAEPVAVGSEAAAHAAASPGGNRVGSLVNPEPADFEFTSSRPSAPAPAEAIDPSQLIVILPSKLLDVFYLPEEDAILLAPTADKRSYPTSAGDSEGEGQAGAETEAEAEAKEEGAIEGLARKKDDERVMIRFKHNETGNISHQSWVAGAAQVAAAFQRWYTFVRRRTADSREKEALSVILKTSPGAPRQRNKDKIAAAAAATAAAAAAMASLLSGQVPADVGASGAIDEDGDDNEQQSQQPAVDARASSRTEAEAAPTTDGGAAAAAPAASKPSAAVTSTYGPSTGRPELEVDTQRRRGSTTTTDTRASGYGYGNGNGNGYGNGNGNGYGGGRRSSYHHPQPSPSSSASSSSASAVQQVRQYGQYHHQFHASPPMPQQPYSHHSHATHYYGSGGASSSSTSPSVPAPSSVSGPSPRYGPAAAAHASSRSSYVRSNNTPVANRVSGSVADGAAAPSVAAPPLPPSQAATVPQVAVSAQQMPVAVATGAPDVVSSELRRIAQLQYELQARSASVLGMMQTMSMPAGSPTAAGAASASAGGQGVTTPEMAAAAQYHHQEMLQQQQQQQLMMMVHEQQQQQQQQPQQQQQQQQQYTVSSPRYDGEGAGMMSQAMAMAMMSGMIPVSQAQYAHAQGLSAAMYGPMGMNMGQMVGAYGMGMGMGMNGMAGQQHPTAAGSAPATSPVHGLSGSPAASSPSSSSSAQPMTVMVPVPVPYGAMPQMMMMGGGGAGGGGWNNQAATYAIYQSPEAWQQAQQQQMYVMQQQQQTQQQHHYGWSSQ